MNTHLYLIWSMEHNAWWRPNSNGYTEDRADAGRYTFDEAAQIVHDANFIHPNKPNEAMKPLDLKDGIIPTSELPRE